MALARVPDDQDPGTGSPSLPGQMNPAGPHMAAGGLGLLPASGEVPQNAGSRRLLPGCGGRDALVGLKEALEGLSL